MCFLLPFWDMLPLQEYVLLNTLVVAVVKSLLLLFKLQHNGRHFKKLVNHILPCGTLLWIICFPQLMSFRVIRISCHHNFKLFLSGPHYWRKLVVDIHNGLCCASSYGSFFCWSIAGMDVVYFFLPQLFQQDLNLELFSRLHQTNRPNLLILFYALHN